MCVSIDEKIHFVILDYSWYFDGHCVVFFSPCMSARKILVDLLRLKKNGNNVTSNNKWLTFSL